MSRPASSFKPNTAAAAPVVAPPTASTAPKRKDPDVVDPAPAAPGPDDSEKKGKFAPPDAAQSNGIVDIASSSERKEYFNIFEKAITMAQFELIYEEYNFLPGNPKADTMWAYIYRIDEKGNVIKGLRLRFDGRSCPKALHYFPPTSTMSASYVTNVPLLDSEFKFVKEKWVPFIRARIVANPGYFYKEAKDYEMWGNIIPVPAVEAIVKKVTDSWFPEAQARKDGKGFYSPSFAAKSRLHTLKTSKGKNIGTGYPPLDIYDMTIADNTKRCIYWHPKDPTPQEAKLAENWDKWDAGVQEMKAEHPDPTKLGNLIPAFSTIDVTVNFLGINNAKSLALSNKVEEIYVTLHSVRTGGTYVKREVGSKPVCSRAGPADPPPPACASTPESAPLDDDGTTTVSRPDDLPSLESTSTSNAPTGDNDGPPPSVE